MRPGPFSRNERAGEVMGWRRTDVVLIDQPCELGYRCPVCGPFPIVDGEYDDRLHWSEYNGFLWCEVCDKDYPSVLCVDLEAVKDPERDWVLAGIDDAIDIFLAGVWGSRE